MERADGECVLAIGQESWRERERTCMRLVCVRERRRRRPRFFSVCVIEMCVHYPYIKYEKKKALDKKKKKRGSASCPSEASFSLRCGRECGEGVGARKLKTK